MEREKKLVSLCLCILFVAFIVVYSLLYQVKGQELLAKMQADLEKKTIQTWTTQISTGETQIFSLELDKVNTGSSTAELTSWVNNSNIVTTGVDAKPVVEEQNQNASTDDASTSQEQEFLMLSGTDLYFWDLILNIFWKIVEKSIMLSLIKSLQISKKQSKSWVETSMWWLLNLRS